MNKLSRYRKLRYNQLFESENRELRLNEMGNPLEVLSQYVDFEIFRYDTTSAEVHDSKGFEGLLDEKDEGKDLYLDAGYVGQEEIVKQHKMNPIICEKGYRNRPLTKEQKSDNRKKSKTRCLVEHVFGFEEQTMRGLVVRTVGLIRAKANVALTSLVYNISRYTQIIRLKPELLG